MIHTIEHAVGFVFYAFMAFLFVVWTVLLLLMLAAVLQAVWREWWVPRRQQARFIAEIERHLEDAA